MYKQLDLFASAATEPEVPEPQKQETIVAEEIAVPENELLPDAVLAFEEEMVVEEEVVVTITPAVEKAVSVKTQVTRPAPKGKRGRKSLKEMDAEAFYIDIPPDEILFKKQYYSIGEVAEMFSLNTSLLRYWETEFDILKPRKNRKGDRHFRPEDIKNLTLIHHLLRQRKYTIEGAKEYLKKNKSKAQENFEMIQRLEKIKSFLLELKAGL